MTATGRRRPMAQRAIQAWASLGPEWLPFADAASPDLPWPRLLRLSLFKFTMGLTTALMVGTLNRVMIFELGVAAWLVALMLALPLRVAPFRAMCTARPLAGSACRSCGAARWCSSSAWR
jgi:BCD family chlorophyll transporter-like MFS transporter